MARGPGWRVGWCRAARSLPRMGARGRGSIDRCLLREMRWLHPRLEPMTLTRDSEAGQSPTALSAGRASGGGWPEALCGLTGNSAYSIAAYALVLADAPQPTVVLDAAQRARRSLMALIEAAPALVC